MKVTKNQTISYTLEISEDEARWLKDKMQNQEIWMPPSGEQMLNQEGMPPSDEHERDKQMRETFWEALGGNITKV